MEVRVQDNGLDGEQVYQAPNQIQGAGQPEECLLLLGILREPEEDEFRDPGPILHIWAVLKPEARALTVGGFPERKWAPHCCPSHPAF